MAFHDIQFPTVSDWGAQGGPGNSTSVQRMDSGQERRIVRWSQFRHYYDVAAKVREHSLTEEVKRFYLARGGLANSFRFKDWDDFNSTESGKDWGDSAATIDEEDQQIGIGDGTTTAFQLVKRYSDAEGTYVRNITKPVEDTTIIAIDGTPTASGWTVNTSTGIVTFSSAPTLGQVIAAGFEFDVEVRFGDGADQYLAIELSNYGSNAIPNLPLVEVLGTGASNEDIHYGGARVQTIAANYTIDLSCLDWSFNATGAGLRVILPSIATVPKGGPCFVIHNVGGTNTFVVVDASLTTIKNVVAGETCMVFHALDSAGASAWKALIWS